tara:strand:- start:40 stop:333 length:294 start_codon:yes stop_codon:yes gene_type:complete
MTPQMIERVTDRLGFLWSEMKDPLPAMKYAAMRMMELGLTYESPKKGQNPQAFARILLADNPVAVEAMQSVMVMLNPERMESAEELIVTVLPGGGSE